jgi:oxygen-independent coproporphyrinogen III oxidase
LNPATQADVPPALTGPVPRYTSYPTANHMRTDVDHDAHARFLAAANTAGPRRPLSFYLHLPFCPSLCHYCGCHVIVTRKQGKMLRYGDLIDEEIRLVARALPDRRRVGQLHLGGGTPNAMPTKSLWRTLQTLRSHFELDDGAELAIEVDPRRVVPLQLGALVAMGFNRVSLGVQDVDLGVQAAIGRHQTLEESTRAVTLARAAGFQAVNIDLVYGLPGQTTASIESTVASIVASRVDRVALFGFAFLPEARPNQRKIDPSTLPDTPTRIALEATARRRFLAAGYVAIGIDHFALPHDPLAQALTAGHLHRNFQGYTPYPPLDTIGLGISAISSFRGAMIQNAKRLADYRAAIQRGRFATERGLEVSADDRLRGRIIERLMCHGAFRWPDLAPDAEASLWDTYPEAKRRLDHLAKEEVVSVTADSVQITDQGFPFVRVVASTFDRYLDPMPSRRLHASI